MNSLDSWLGDIKNVYPETICPKNNAALFSVTECGADGMTKLCADKRNIDECDENDKALIYVSGKPSDVYIDLAKYLEKEQDCVGICNLCPHAMYTDCGDGSSSDTCEQKLADLVNGMSRK